MSIKYVLPLLFILWIFPAFAQESKTEEPKKFEMSLPIKCELGETCWFLNYVDTNPDEALHEDFTCNNRSYDGHKGVDIAIRDSTEMKKGYDVLAVADGTILRHRDGQDDGFKTHDQFEKLSKENLNCGNGIIIDHGDGWLSQYCHLKKGSLGLVKNGKKIRRGLKIAEIGMSGVTEHPHIHLTTIYKGKIIDPFTGKTHEEGCNKKGDETLSLWRDKDIKYKDFSLYDAGFTAEAPVFEMIPKGDRGALPRKDSSILFTWLAYFGAKKGDEITVKLTDPTGQAALEKSIIQKTDKARQYYYFGKKSGESNFKTGTWRVTFTVSRTMEDRQIISEDIIRAVDIF